MFWPLWLNNDHVRPVSRVSVPTEVARAVARRYNGRHDLISESPASVLTPITKEAIGLS